MTAYVVLLVLNIVGAIANLALAMIPENRVRCLNACVFVIVCISIIFMPIVGPPQQYPYRY